MRAGAVNLNISWIGIFLTNHERTDNVGFLPVLRDSFVHPLRRCKPDLLYQPITPNKPDEYRALVLHAPEKLL